MPLLLPGEGAPNAGRRAVARSLKVFNMREEIIMSNGPHGNGPRAGEIRSIDWRGCFPFTRIFGTFQMAVHPGKLALAVIAIVLTGLWGFVLDSLHPTAYRPVAMEVDAFWQTDNLESWRERAAEEHFAQLQDAARTAGVTLNEDARGQFAENPDAVVAQTLREVATAYRTARAEWREDYREYPRDERAAEIARRARPYNIAYQRIEALGTQGVFRSFIDYQGRVGHQMLVAAVGLNFAGGATDVITTRVPGGTLPIVAEGPWAALAETLELPVGTGVVQVGERTADLSVIACVMLMLRGVQWLLAAHCIYFLFFVIPVLVLWALYGGAICRMAALNIARDERITPRAAITFATRKIYGFVTAPLFPVGLVLLPAVALFIGGLIISIPGLGELLGGIGLGLGLLAGGVIALVVVGAIAGGSLLWPTVAVEGSDGFDAISRSYSYVFARPWRAAFYAAVALVYGAICYLFVRFFILVALKAARFFTGAGMAYLTRPNTGSPGATKIDTLWPAPSWYDLRPERVAFGMENWEVLGSALFALWLMLVVALLWAFVISFYLSASTVIYTLLRQRVDGTDFEDVYTEADEQPEWPEAVEEQPLADDMAEETGVAPSTPPSERVVAPAPPEPEPEPEPETKAPPSPAEETAEPEDEDIDEDEDEDEDEDDNDRSPSGGA